MCIAYASKVTPNLCEPLIYLHVKQINKNSNVQVNIKYFTLENGIQSSSLS